MINLLSWKFLFSEGIEKSIISFASLHVRVNLIVGPSLVFTPSSNFIIEPIPRYINSGFFELYLAKKCGIISLFNNFLNVGWLEWAFGFPNQVIVLLCSSK